MLRLYDGADGVKTGYTKKALRCLVSSATRNGQQLVAVTLNDGNDWNDHASLLNFGFNHYPLKTLIERGDKVSGYELVTGKDFNYPLGKGEQEHLVTKMILQSEGNADRVKNSSTDFGLKGVLQLKLGGKEIGRIPLYAPNSLPPEQPEYPKKLSSATAVAYPSNTLMEAIGSALRALFQAGGSEKIHD